MMNLREPRLRKLNDDLDVLGLSLEGAHERVRWFAARDETGQPRAIRVGQGLSRPVPVTLVGVDAADDDVVLEHGRCRDVSGGGANRGAAGTDTGEAHDASRRDPLDRVVDDLPDPGAFDDHVRLEARVGNDAGVVSRPQGTNELGLGPRLDPVEHVHLEPVLLADEGRKKTDRSGAGNEHVLRHPEGTLADGEDLLPRFRDNGRGLEQYTQEAE
jgi:hypothetical protein